jgi:uncharacterized protein (DUF58 family)
MQINREQIHKLGSLEILAKQVVQGFITGLHKSPFHGFSVEFAEHRQYNPGEATRHIDWKLFGRSDRLYVKQYEEETNLRCKVLLDVSPSMFFPKKGNTLSKFEFSSIAAASIMEILRKQRDAFGINLFDESTLFDSEVKSTSSHFSFLIDQLENVEEGQAEKRSEKTPLAETLHRLAETSSKRSLLIVFSDFYNQDNLSELFDAFNHLRYNKHEVVLFHVIEHDVEATLNLENREYAFVDSETGEEIKAYPNQIREQYLEKFNAQKKDLELLAGQAKIDYVETIVNEGVEKVLLQYLQKRKKILRK